MFTLNNGLAQCSLSAVKAAQKRTRANLHKEGRPISCVSGGDEGKWMLGRVQKIRRRSGTKWGLSRQPIDLQNKPHVKYGKKGYSQPTLMVLLQWFISAPHPIVGNKEEDL